ncbi:DUF2800 domain-containing protein, partial [Klebsiella pneumoniae]
GWEGTGEWKITDDVVKFSKVRAQLRPRAEKNFQLVDKYELIEAPLLTNEEIAEIKNVRQRLKNGWNTLKRMLYKKHEMKAK